MCYTYRNIAVERCLKVSKCTHQNYFVCAKVDIAKTESDIRDPVAVVEVIESCVYGWSSHDE